MSAPRTVGDAERRARIGRLHRLAPETRTDDVTDIVRSLVAVHSSDPASVHLACAARMANPSIAAVEAALYEQRTIVRHHAMRRTIWVMTIDNARRAHVATTEKIAAGERKRTLKAIEASTDIADPEAWFERARREVIDLVTDAGSLTTREVGERLGHLAVPIQFGNEKHHAILNAHTKVLQGAAFDGDLVRGRPGASWVSAEYPWSATESWLGEPLRGLDLRHGAAELLDAWLRSFGPGTETDLVWWFGATKTLVRNALADAGAVPVRLDDGRDGWIAQSDVDEIEPGSPWVRFLPGLDSTAMGWKERDWYLDPAWAPDMYDRFGNLGPSIWVDGRIVGGWAQRPDATIVYEVFEPLDPTRETLLREAVEQLSDVVDDVVVRPRFPARMQKRLLGA